MKKLLLFLIFIPPSLIIAQSNGFIHPIEFNDTEDERTKVIEYIKSNVKKLTQRSVWTIHLLLE